MNVLTPIFPSPVRAVLALTFAFLPLQESARAEISGQDQIRQAVHDFLASHYAGASTADNWQRVEIEVASMDPRLQLDPCPQALDTRLHQDQPPVGKVTVRVACAGDAPWSRYIPAHVRVYQNVVQSARPLSRGTQLSRDDLTLAEQDISTLRGSWVQDPQDVVGMALKRALPAGAVVSTEALSPPVLVRRGETVVLTAQRGTVAIRQQGVALQDGELGRQISVRNPHSERVVQATVTGSGEAEVVF